MMVHTLGKRMSVDMLFFLVVMVVLLNVIFGIIIDTFGDLRTKKIERLQDTTEKCFICGIDKPVFDRASDTPNGFKTHIRFDHNMWNYLFFIVYIWEQDKDDDDGLEQFVRRSLDANDLSWFPMNRAMRLTSTVSPEEELRAHLTNDVEASDRHLMQKINIFQSDVCDSLDKILFYLKSDDPDEHALVDLPVTGNKDQIHTDDDDDDFARSMLSTTRASSHQGSRSSRKQKKSSVLSRGDVSFLSDDIDSTVPDEEEDTQGPYKQITIQLESIVEGSTPLSPKDSEGADATMFCRIISNTGSDDVPIDSISDGVLQLRRMEVVVSQNSCSDDTGTCIIELRRSVGGSKGGSEVVAAVEVSYGELISMSSGSVGGATKEFRWPGSERRRAGSFLRFYINCAAAIDL